MTKTPTFFNTKFILCRINFTKPKNVKKSAVLESQLDEIFEWTL